jgi:lipoprotein-releasing system permease protein
VYQLLLTRKYLTSKVMPLLASLAVVLCVAMVLTVWSVMGGFLNKLMNSGRTLIGDVLIGWPNAGFPYAEDLVRRLEADPLVLGATPVIETYGLLTLPSDRTEYVVVKGIEPAGYTKVTGFDESLWWRPIEKPMPKDTGRVDWRLDAGFMEEMRDALANGRSMTRADRVTGENEPAIVMGIEVGDNIRLPEGPYVPAQTRRAQSDGSVRSINLLPIRDGFVRLNVLPMDSKGRVLDMSAERFPIANEFKTGMFEVDNRTVLVPLASLQRMLKMDEARRVSADESVVGGTARRDGGGETFARPTATEIDPARVTTVFVRARPGVEARELQIRCAEIYAEFAAAHPRRVPDPPEIDSRDGVKRVVPVGGSIQIKTWEDQNRTFIEAVKKETGLVLFIFSFISLTAVFLVLAIFWSMVSEKTKDVGILRSMGASRTGVATVWLAYGLSIGVVGSLLGGALAYAVVTNINPIHDWMGEVLRIQIWDPRIYYFTEIPSRVEGDKAMIVMIGGALSSVVGAMIPALRAAFLHPVKALRFE